MAGLMSNFCFNQLLFCSVVFGFLFPYKTSPCFYSVIQTSKMHIVSSKLQLLLTGIVFITEFHAAPSTLQKGRMKISHLALADFQVRSVLFLGSDKHGKEVALVSLSEVFYPKSSQTQMQGSIGIIGLGFILYFQSSLSL